MSKKHPADRAFELVELAGIYVDDGAFRTAAMKLRAAADLLDGIAAATDPTQGAAA